MGLIVHRNTGDNNHLRTFVRQETEIFFQFLVGIVRFIRFVQQIKQLSQIRSNHIRLGYQMTHFLHHIHIKVGIKPSIVSQHRIGYYQTIRLTEILDKIGNNLNLSRRAQITGINSIKLYLQFLPFGNDFRHFIRQVQKGEAGILGVIGQHCRRKRTDLKAHRGQYRNNDCQRNASHPRKIVNGSYLLYFICIHINLLLDDF